MDLTYYWSKTTNKRVDQRTGEEIAGSQSELTEIEWNETLVQTIIDAINELQKITLSTWGRAIRKNIDVYVRGTTLSRFTSSPRFVPCEEKVQHVENSRIPKNNASKLVADFGDFKLHDHKILDKNVIRIVATFKIDEKSDRTLYANVRIVD